MAIQQVRHRNLLVLKFYQKKNEVMTSHLFHRVPSPLKRGLVCGLRRYTQSQLNKKRFHHPLAIAMCRSVFLEK
jgi:hypothetical protein